MKWFRAIENDRFCVKLLLHVFILFFLFLLLGNLSWSERAANAISPDNPSAALLPMRCLELIAQTFLFCFVLRLYSGKLLRKDPGYFRVTTGNLKSKWLWAGIAAPGLLLCVYLLFSRGRFERGSLDVLTGLSLTFLHGGLKAGVTEEILFRGVYMKLFETRWNKGAAVVLNSFLFAFVHLGNTAGITKLEICMMLLSYTAAGVTFSLVTYRENSVVNSVFMHAFWNIIAESNILRVLVSSAQYDPNAIVNYRLESENILLSGGFFGISASILAVFAFLLPLCLFFTPTYNNMMGARTWNRKSGNTWSLSFREHRARPGRSSSWRS